ncbi:hypothetical protein MRX96_057216 [Rhipicephalus microplus]
MADLEEDTGKPRQVIFYKAGMKDDVYAILKSVAIHEDLTFSEECEISVGRCSAKGGSTTRVLRADLPLTK